MAGAGYRLFNTGDVLTAAQVNTFLMEQTVMVFNDAASRTTALSGVVAEGMLSYLKSTKQVEVYNGSAWVASDDPNAIQNTIVDAKGDLITATAADTPARLAVGESGSTLVADSSASTGLRWQGNFAAGKNKILNSDFSIWQRGTSFSGNAFSADRWFADSDATLTTSQQTFTPGAAPVAGYEGTFFIRYAKSAGGTYFAPRQRIEDVRIFAGQTVTLSFWAKANATVTIAPYYQQLFGTGGSATVGAEIATQSITTSWTRYSFTFTLPNVSGKTIGGGSCLEIFTARYVGSAATTIDIWGVQLEAGSIATAFQTATGTLAGELAACQRYYQRITSTNTFGRFGTGFATGTTNVQCAFPLKQTMRTSVTSLDLSGNTTFTMNDGVSNTNTNAAPTLDTMQNPDVCLVIFSVASGLTQFRPYHIAANNNTAAFIGFNAEL